jgi:hypothetical protein
MPSPAAQSDQRKQDLHYQAATVVTVVLLLCTAALFYF